MNFYQSRWAAACLIAVWVLVRIYHVCHQDLSLGYEIVNVQKLGEYGFAKRGGAVLTTAWMTGRLAYPEDRNLVDHPYPAVWMFILPYALGGTTACVAMLLAARLAGMLLVWKMIRDRFSPDAAWWAMLFYALAPVGTVFDSNTDAVATGHLLWPVAVWLALRAGEGRGGAVALGATVFVSGQLGWMSHLLGPALLVLAWPQGGSWRALWAAPGPRAVIIGGSLTLLLFVAQIFTYSPNLADNVRYIATQAGLGSGEISRTRMLAAAVLRCAFFAGLGLTLAGLPVAWRVLQKKETRRLPMAMTVFLPGFALFLLVFTKFCFIEKSPYSFLLIPCTVLAAAAFEGLRSPWLRLALLAPSLVCAGYLGLATTLPVESNTSRVIAKAIAEHTAPDEFVLTNLTLLRPPFASWDVGAPVALSVRSDRLVVMGVQTHAQANATEEENGRNFRRAVLCVADEAPAIEPAWETELRAENRIAATVQMTIEPTPDGLAGRLREMVWRFSGRYANRGGNRTPEPHDLKLTFYRLK